jgi:hypothetical protein
MSKLCYPKVPFSRLLVAISLTFLVPLATCGRAQAQTGVKLDGVNDHVTFGPAATLGASTFTVECWFRREGAGVVTTTGTGGLTNAIPLVSKGRGEAETPANLNMNYFLGIRSDGVIAGDFEEGSGPNHPIAGVTPIQLNLWYHAALTYDAATARYRLYLNGAIEKDTTLAAGITPASTSIQHAALGTAMTSTGAAAGYFLGTIDEPRIWNVARTQAQIQSGLAVQLTSGAGLLGRWGLNEGAGTTAANAVAGGAGGTLVNGPTWTTGSPFALSYALKLGAASTYVTFGNNATLGLPQFTLETWFRRDGAGSTASTGSGGVVALPLVTRGMAETDGSNVDMNWFLGIRGSDSVLVADFEEGASGATPGLNHPVIGVTPLVRGRWYHAAATYDGNTWRLYLDGSLETALAVGQPPQSASIQHAGLGVALTSTGVASGHFDGALDEARVWDRARTEAEIRGAANSAITSSTTGLVARWGLDEGVGSTATGTAGTTVHGTITGTGWTWAAPAPFDLAFVFPADPTGVTATAVTHAQVEVTWTDNSSDEQSFQVERSTTGEAGSFTLLASVGPDVVSCSDIGVTPGTSYCYRVRAHNDAGFSAYATPACATTPAQSNTALDLAGTNAYVTFGAAPALGLSEFTIECWFRRDGAGVNSNTGSGGMYALPLVTKGRGEAEGSTVDMNWFLGIRASDGVLAADFEEGAAGAAPGLNHPVSGVTPIVNGLWYHGAVTYDGATWRLYLNGALENTLTVGRPPRFDSIQHAALGSALNSTGVAEGFFDGAIDEARVWNYSRTESEIAADMNTPLPGVHAGLVARWGLDEGAGTAVASSSSTALPGLVTGAGYAWVTGATFDAHANHAPALPLNAGPADGETGVSASPALAVQVSDPDGDPMEVTFYGRMQSGAAGADFTLVLLPDAQNYTSQAGTSSSAMLKAQTQWVVANRVSRNIVFVSQIGDLSETGDAAEIQWMRADTAMAILEDPLTTGLEHGVPFDVTVGNHDQTPNGDPTAPTVFYNKYFGPARFAGRPYYGGHREPERGNDHFSLFSAGGLDWILVSLQYSATVQPAAIVWADSLLTAYAGRKAIVVVHNMLNPGNPAPTTGQGAGVYDALKSHANIALMVCGHAAGEGRRSDAYAGHTIHTLLQDYQDRASGGSGWMRVLEFSPANDVVRVRTYSPWLDQWEADADSSSQFTLPLDLSGGPAFAALGTVSAVASGETATLPWPGLEQLSGYEWYAIADDGGRAATSATWSFVTRDTEVPVVTVIAPNGGESWTVGSSHAITWSATDNVGVTGVDVLLSRAGTAGPWEALATGVANTGTRTWTVAGAASSNARIKVVAHDAATNAGEDLGNAAFAIVGTAGVDADVVAEFALAPVRPNPMCGAGHVAFDLPREAHLRVTVHDLQGRSVAVLADGLYPAGRHSVIWSGRTDAGRAVTGMYFVRMEAGGREFVRRVAVMR